MYAIIETGGKQYRVAPGDKIRVERLPAGEGETVTFDRVLAVERDGEFRVGTPTVPGARVSARVVGHGKGPKILVFKFRAKSNYRRRQGHRQPFTELQIESIEG
ncbi:50S ribosomal protein L21 [Caldinitratiruptor microaerophilus]|uniref:50S ribosomal protein L21 n=1 Tax=Caldinitratiruptor microaerophilus TaxID=671077 RepID=UPI0022304687|nr:50S ribosomal protein L21 [Caldinitratiruptor microaerophilus]